MRWYGLGLVTLLLTGQAGAERPHRVSSLDLCTDQLVMILADPADIASLSPLARDPQVSVLATAAAGFPDNRASAEIILRDGTDLVLGVDGIDTATIALLRRLGVRVETMALVDRIDQIAPAIRKVAGWLGQEARGEAAIAAMREGLDRNGGAPAAAPPSAVIYDANGYTVGNDTLKSDALASAGLLNRAADLGIVGYAPLGLEELVAHPPDLIITEHYESGGDSLAEDWLNHPALRHLPSRHENLPAPLLLCGTPSVADAVARLSEFRRRLTP